MENNNIEECKHKDEVNVGDNINLYTNLYKELDYNRQVNNGNDSLIGDRCGKIKHWTLDYFIRLIYFVTKYNGASGLTLLLNTLFEHNNIFEYIDIISLQINKFIHYTLKETFDHETLMNDPSNIFICNDHESPVIGLLISTYGKCIIHSFNSKMNKKWAEHSFSNIICHNNDLLSTDVEALCKNASNIIIISTVSQIDLYQMSRCLANFDKYIYYWNSDFKLKFVPSIKIDIIDQIDQLDRIDQLDQIDQINIKYNNIGNNINNCKSSHRILKFFFNFLNIIAKNNRSDILNIFQYNIFGKKNCTKEIIENMTAVYNIFTYIKNNYNLQMINDPNIIVICHGDGKQPRSGFLFSALSLWTVHAIDPELDELWTKQQHLPNLICHKSIIEDIDLTKICKNKFVIIVGVHSHAHFDKLWHRLDNIAFKRLALSIPCCKHITHTIQKTTIVNMYEMEIPNKNFNDEQCNKISTTNNIRCNRHILMWSD